MPRFTVLLFPEEGGYSVLVPSLPGCATQGDSIDEALAMAREAIGVCLEGMAEDGDEIPSDDVPPLVATIDVAEPAKVGA
jgi:antitoxin HicB